MKKLRITGDSLPSVEEIDCGGNGRNIALIQ